MTNRKKFKWFTLFLGVILGCLAFTIPVSAQDQRDNTVNLSYRPLLNTSADLGNGAVSDSVQQGVELTGYHVFGRAGRLEYGGLVGIGYEALSYGADGTVTARSKCNSTTTTTVPSGLNADLFTGRIGPEMKYALAPWLRAVANAGYSVVYADGDAHFGTIRTSGSDTRHGYFAGGGLEVSIAKNVHLDVGAAWNRLGTLRERGVVVNLNDAVFVSAGIGINF